MKFPVQALPYPFLFFLLIGAVSPASGDKIDDAIQTEMKNRGIPGLSLAIVQNGQPMKIQAYGSANLEHQVSTRIETSYCIASITKQFVATGIMLLVAEGKLSLEDSPAKYLDNLPTQWKNITLRQMLSHTSGIIDVENDLPTVADTVTMLAFDYTDEELLDLAKKRPLNFNPGEKYSYSNTGFHMSGMIIKKLTGKNWGAFLKERIFDPLEMENTRINRLDEIVPHRASGYWIVSRDIVVNGPPVSPSMMAYAAGGLRSTVIDLMKWDAALDSGKILNLKQLQQMWQPTPLNNGTTTPYGLGWSVKDYNGQRMISHSGGRESGYSTYMAKFPDHRLTIILLTNQYNGASPRDLAKTIVELVLPQLAAEPTDFREK